MRTGLKFCTALGCALAAIACLPSTVRAQEFPSLPGAVDSSGGEVWSGGDPGGAVVDPGLASEYLTPIPNPEGNAFSSALPSSVCSSCNGDGALGGFYNRCGCETPLFPYFTGPGNCDNWCVGPHWNVEVDGMFIHREDAAWEDLGADVVQQFDYGPGVRIFATGYNYSNYGLQIGYEGVNDFHSSGFTANDDFTFESNLNSLEVNVIRRNSIPLKLFVGARYVEIDEEILATTFLATGDPESDTGDVGGTLIENRLMGVQVGALRDAWHLNRWVTLEPYGNAGAYFNDFKREDFSFDQPSGAVVVDKNEFDEIAFLGEAGVTGILRINACLALRGGYQVMVFQNVGDGLTTSTLDRGFDADELLYHGARFGIEYQR
jgi:hypothetical protein